MKKIFAVVGLFLLLFVVVVLFNTFTLETKSSKNFDYVAVALERTQIPERLANAIKIRTISEENESDIEYENFLRLHQYINEQFPLVTDSLVRETVNTYSLLYQWQGSNPAMQPILLLSHMDVVPVVAGTEELWEHGPFSGDIADGYIWGRGTIDDKQGVLGILEAVEQLLSEGYQPKRSIYLAFGHDEERSGAQGAKLIAEKLKSRGVRTLFTMDEGGGIMEGSTFGVDKKIAMVMTSEKGYVSLRLTASGQGGHSSMPPGETAVATLSKAVAAVSDKKFPIDTSIFEEMIAYLANDMPFTLRLMGANIGLFKPLLGSFVQSSPEINAMFRTTTAPTMLSGSPKDNVLPIYARAVINHRIMPGETIESTRNFVIEAIGDERIEVEIINQSSNPSPVASTTSQGYEIISRTIQQIATDELIIVPSMTPAATDSKHYAEISEDVYRFVFMDLDPALIHGTNERISIENYLDAIRFYIQLIKNSDQVDADPNPAVE